MDSNLLHSHNCIEPEQLLKRMMPLLVKRFFQKRAFSFFRFLTFLSFLAAANGVPGQTVPVVHWINDSNQNAYTWLSSGSNFITNFKATNDVQVTLVTGSVNSIYQEAYAGLGPNNNNPAFLTNFIGLAINGTGDGGLGHLKCIETSLGGSTVLQFDFAVPLTPYDRLLIMDVDTGERYGIQAFFGGQSLNLSRWNYAAYSGEASQLPDSTWPTWNSSDGSLTANTAGNLSEPLSVLAPNQLVDRVVITRFQQGNGSIAIQFVSLPVPGASPVLQIQPVGSNVVVSWPGTFDNYSLYTATNLAPPIAWSPVGTQPSLNATRLAVTNLPAASARFYRLQMQ